MIVYGLHSSLGQVNISALYMKLACVVSYWLICNLDDVLDVGGICANGTGGRMDPIIHYSLNGLLQVPKALEELLKI